MTQLREDKTSLTIGEPSEWDDDAAAEFIAAVFETFPGARELLNDEGRALGPASAKSVPLAADEKEVA